MVHQPRITAAYSWLPGFNVKEMAMQQIALKNNALPKDDSSENVLRREVLKLSDLDPNSVSDLSSMFGKWFEVDHCDKDDY